MIDVAIEATYFAYADSDPTRSPLDKLRHALAAYRAKYGCLPQEVRVHPLLQSDLLKHAPLRFDPDGTIRTRGDGDLLQLIADIHVPRGSLYISELDLYGARQGALRHRRHRRIGGDAMTATTTTTLTEAERQWPEATEIAQIEVDPDEGERIRVIRYGTFTTGIWFWADPDDDDPGQDWMMYLDDEQRTQLIDALSWDHPAQTGDGTAGGDAEEGE